MQGLKSKVAAEKAAQGALEENAGARRKLRKAVAARDAAYGMDDGAEALLLRALDAFADRVAERAADHALHREGEDAEVSAVDAQLCLEGRWGVDVPGVPAATPARPAPRREAFSSRRVDPTAAATESKKRKGGVIFRFLCPARKPRSAKGRRDRDDYKGSVNELSGLDAADAP